MMFCPQYNKEHRKLLEKLYQPSCELQRVAEEKITNEQRLERYKRKKEDLDVTEPWYAHIDGDLEYQQQFTGQEE